MLGKSQQKVERVGKKTSQGRSKRTKLSATPTRARRKRYRGQGKG